ncbi:hypothetical protein ABK040_012269 [Willaertia magna]
MNPHNFDNNDFNNSTTTTTVKVDEDGLPIISKCPFLQQQQLQNYRQQQQQNNLINSEQEHKQKFEGTSTSTSNNNNLSISFEELHGIKPKPTERIPVTYNSYIQTDNLLHLQGAGVKGGLHHHDEHLFIVVHQSFELWFKQILFELDSIQHLMKKIVSPLLLSNNNNNEDDSPIIVNNNTNENNKEENQYNNNDNNNERKVLINNEVHAHHSISLTTPSNTPIYIYTTEGEMTIEQTQILVHRLHRSDQILRYSLGTFDILENMHPADFLEFRDLIGPASGFQSVQMRELEVLLGLKDSNRKLTGGRTSYETDIVHDKIGLKRLQLRKADYNLKQLVYRWLELIIYPKVPKDFIEVFLQKKKENLLDQKSRWFNPETEKDLIEKYIAKELRPAKDWIDIADVLDYLPSSKQHVHPMEGNKELNEEEMKQRKLAIKKKERIKKRRIACLFVMCFRHHHRLWEYANLLDKLVAFEEALLLWRTRHVRMVERMIGTRSGTGGSSGVDYLEGTLKYRVFMDLWQSRSHFIQSTCLPAVEYDYDKKVFYFVENKKH